MKIEYTCPKCGTTGNSEVYRMGRGKDDGLYTCIACWRVWAEEYRRRIKKMEGRIKEVFNLEWIRNFAEQNIHDSEWIEEGCGEKRRILVIETLVHGGYGAYIPGLVLDMFGQAEGYDLEDPYNYEQNETIHEALMFLEQEVNDCLNRLLPSKGTYYMGYHEYDGSYCLFYEEYEEEVEQD